MVKYASERPSIHARGVIGAYSCLSLTHVSEAKPTIMKWTKKDVCIVSLFHFVYIYQVRFYSDVDDILIQETLIGRIRFLNPNL